MLWEKIPRKLINQLKKSKSHRDHVENGRDSPLKEGVLLVVVSISVVDITTYSANTGPNQRARACIT